MIEHPEKPIQFFFERPLTNLGGFFVLATPDDFEVPTTHTASDNDVNVKSLTRIGGMSPI